MKKLFVMVLIACICLAACSKKDKDSSEDDVKESIESSNEESTESKNGESTDYNVKVDPEVVGDVGLASFYEYPFREADVLWGSPTVAKKEALSKEKSDEIKDIFDKLEWKDKNGNINECEWYELELSLSDEEKYYIDLSIGGVMRVIQNKYHLSYIPEELCNYFAELYKGRAEGFETDENGCLTEKGCADYSMFILGKLLTRPNGLGEWLYVGTIGLTDNLVVTTKPGDDEDLYYVTINRGDESINNWDELHSVQFVVNSKRAALYRVDEMTYSTPE